MKNIQQLIIEWAKERNLLHKENASKQKLKLIEECGELASAILKQDVQKQKDAIGDIFIVLVILAEQLETELVYIKDEFSFTNLHSIINIIYLSCEHGNLDYSVTNLFMLCKNLELDFNECINIAYNEIKDRKGETINGTFIKAE